MLFINTYTAEIGVFWFDVLLAFKYDESILDKVVQYVNPEDLDKYEIVNMQILEYDISKNSKYSMVVTKESTGLSDFRFTPEIKDASFPFSSNFKELLFKFICDEFSKFCDVKKSFKGDTQIIISAKYCLEQFGLLKCKLCKGSHSYATFVLEWRTSGGGPVIHPSTEQIDSGDIKFSIHQLPVSDILNAIEYWHKYVPGTDIERNKDFEIFVDTDMTHFCHLFMDLKDATQVEEIKQVLSTFSDEHIDKASSQGYFASTAFVDVEDVSKLHYKMEISYIQFDFVKAIINILEPYSSIKELHFNSTEYLTRT